MALTQVPTPTPGITKEPFENFNEGSIMLNPENYPAVSDYADVYNQNIALLDDPRNMINASFNTYLQIQNKKISNLRKNLTQLETDIQNKKIDAIQIKGFKSMNNSQIVNVEPYNDFNYTPIIKNSPTTTQNTPSTSNQDTTAINFTTTTKHTPTTTNPMNYNVRVNGANQYPNYLIYGNNGCLQYEPSVNTIDIYGNNKIVPATWDFKSCNANEPRQQFVSTQVNDLSTYNSFITDPSNVTSRKKEKSNIIFGFNVVNPINNQDQCLQLNNDGLSVMPCNLDFEQRFRPVYNTVLP